MPATKWVKSPPGLGCTLVGQHDHEHRFAGEAPRARHRGRGRRAVAVSGFRSGRAGRRPAMSPGCSAASALVLFMTLPGLALFYGGLVRAKNAAFGADALLCRVPVSPRCCGLVIGYSLAFDGDGAMLGGTWAGVSSAGSRAALPGSGLPESVFVAVPDDLRGDHAGADHRRLCRSGSRFRAVLLFIGLVAAAGLCSGGALGVGRRLARRAGDDRFRRRHRRAHDGRGLGARHRADDRPAPRLPATRCSRRTAPV